MKTAQDAINRISALIDNFYFNIGIREDNGYKILVDDSVIAEIRGLLWIFKEDEEEKI